MLHIFFGDDTSSSRKSFIEMREDLVKKGYDSFVITQQSLPDLKNWLYNSTSLFSNKKALFGENILNKKEYREKLKEFETGDIHTEILIWEENTDEKTIKFGFKDAKLHQSKLPITIFKFLDSIIPGNLNTCLDFLDSIVESVDSNIVLFMTQRRVKELVMISQSIPIEKKLAGWQLSRLSQQAKKWDKKKLINFYDGLYRIEVMTKTNGGFYDIKKALDILLCYYL